MTIEDLVAQSVNTFDLVVISDVMHHIAQKSHSEFLLQTRKVLKPGRHLVLKEWEQNRTLIHLMVYLSDRFITGDHCCYRTVREWKEIILGVFGENSIKDQKRIQPWSNNVAFFIKA